MKYYSIGIPDDLKVIGYYPQLKFRNGYNPSLSDGYYNLPVHDFPDFVPNLEYELHEKAKPLNILPPYPSRFALMIDEKVKKILEKHCLPPHAFYPTKVYHNYDVLQYYWFHYIPNDFWELLDSKNSYGDIIKIKLAKATKIGEVPIISREQIIKEKKKYTGLQMLVLGKLRMSPEFCKYDFYKTDAFNHTIISEKLKNELEKNDITGYYTKFFDKIGFD